MKKFTVFVLVISFSLFMLLRETQLDKLDPGTGKTIIDDHVHIAGLGYGNSGCFINKDMRNNFRFPLYLWSMDVTENELIKHGDQILVKKISAKIARSKTVKQAVILAMDGYVDSKGEHKGQLNLQATQIFVPNDYVAAETAKYDNLLFGASINPNRDDAEQRLLQVKKQGAVLIKWIPSIMNIDPADKQYTSFYRLMARLKIPLLTHTGMEKSFANAKNELADPERLKLPLELGVTVIAAHIATTGKTEGQDNFSRILPMLKKYPNLYVDISSLTQANKLNYLAVALKEKAVKEKMIYGSDWPLIFFPMTSPWYHINHISIADAWEAGGIRNQWDRDIALKSALNVPEEVFLRTQTILNPVNPAARLIDKAFGK